MCYSSWIMLACHITLSNRFFLYTVSLIEECILFTTNSCSTHPKCDWSLYCLVCVWYANSIEIEDPILVYYDHCVKILDCSLKRSVTLFEKMIVHSALNANYKWYNGLPTLVNLSHAILKPDNTTELLCTALYTIAQKCQK